VKPVIIIAIAFVLLIPITVFAESSEITINPTQLSEIKDIIQESNLINLSLLAVSITIASVAVLATMITAYYLKRQVHSMELEFESTLEPLLVIISFEPAQVFFHNGAVEFYDKWNDTPNHQYSDLQKVKMKFTIKNVGQGTAKDIVYIRYFDDNVFSRSIFENMSETKTNAILAPDQEFRITFDIKIEQWRQLTQTKNLFSGLSISYMGLKNKKYTGMIYGIRKGGNYILDSW